MSSQSYPAHAAQPRLIPDGNFQHLRSSSPETIPTNFSCTMGNTSSRRVTAQDRYGLLLLPAHHVRS